MDEYVLDRIAPLTRIGVKKSEGIVILSHQFPVALEATVASCFANMEQGFVCTSLTVPAADALALVSLIQEHVPEGTPIDDVFFQTTAEALDTGLFVTIGIMRSLTDTERAQPDPPKTFLIQKEEGACRVLMMVTFTRAHAIAAAIERIAVDVTRRLTEHLPEPLR